MQYTALDVHKQFVFGTSLTAQGQVIRHFRFPTTPKALSAFAKKLTDQDAVCLESTTNAVPIYQLLSQHAGRVVISNPLQTKAIAHAKIKTDKVDSEVLAQLLRTGFLPTVWVPDEQTLHLRQLSSYRLALVRQRTQVKNRIHSILHRNLVVKPEVSDLFGKTGRAFLERVQLPEHERFQLDQELLLLEALEAQIAAADKRLAEAAVPTAELQLLLSIPGCDLQTAVGVLAAVGDVTRFPADKNLASYFGLDPLGKRSADHPFGPTRISKRGRSHARWLLIEAATAAVRVPGPLQSFYVRLHAKKGHNKAIVATARKLACLVWHMLTRGEPYAWAPPMRTHEKIRKVQILAGAPRRKPGPKQGQPSQGGEAGRRARRSADHDLAKLAQKQYEELIRRRTKSAERS